MNLQPSLSCDQPLDFDIKVCIVFLVSNTRYVLFIVELWLWCVRVSQSRVLCDLLNLIEISKLPIRTDESRASHVGHDSVSAASIFTNKTLSSKFVKPGNVGIGRKFPKGHPSAVLQSNSPINTKIPQFQSNVDECITRPAGACSVRIEAVNDLGRRRRNSDLKRLAVGERKIIRCDLSSCIYLKAYFVLCILLY